MSQIENSGQGSSTCFTTDASFQMKQIEEVIIIALPPLEICLIVSRCCNCKLQFVHASVEVPTLVDMRRLSGQEALQYLVS
jgi:hypothetical protein